LMPSSAASNNTIAFVWRMLRRRRPAPPVVDMVRLVGDYCNHGSGRHGPNLATGRPASNHG
jgi:xanthosine utilization system XapX-like protein